MLLVLLVRLVVLAQKLCLIQVHLLYLLSQETATTSTSAVPNSIWRVIAYHIIDYVNVDVQLDTICTSIRHNFLVVTSLIATVILGIDVFQQHGLI